MKPEIQRIRDLPRRDVAIYEHTETKERRKLTGKAVATWGLKEAWRRAADTTTG